MKIAPGTRPRDMRQSVIGLMVNQDSLQMRCAAPVAVDRLIMTQMSKPVVKLRVNLATLLNTNVLKASFA